MDKRRIRVRLLPDANGLSDADLGIIGDLFTVRLQRAEHLLRGATSQAWAGYALRAGSIGVLSLIVAQPGISQIDIARRTTLDKSAITAIVNKFDQLGWAERRPSATDGRRHALHATEEGRTRLLEVSSRIKEIEARMLADVPARTLATLSQLLDLVHNSCLTAIHAND